MRLTARWAGIIGLMLAIQPWVTQASNVGFLKNSLLEQLTSADITSLKQEISKTLNEAPDQDIIRWQSASNNIHVQILPKLSFKEGLHDCRRTLFKFSNDKRKTEYYRFDICKDSQGRWLVSDSLIRKMQDSDWALLENTLSEVLESDHNNRIPASWFNPESKNSGVIVPISTLSHEGKPCRELAISMISATGGTMDGHYTFCKVNNAWQRMGEKQ